MGPNQSNYNMMFPNGTGGYGGSYGGGNQLGSDYTSSSNNSGPSNSANPNSDMLASGIGGLGAGLMGLFGGNGQNPANAAQPFYNQITQTNQQYLNPYNQAGQTAMGNLQGQYAQLMNNPGAMFNTIGQSYHQSPGFQFALHQAMMAGNQAGAAGGMAGSPMQQQQNMGLATQMGNQDYYNYMNHAMQMYGQGLQGEQGIMGQGANAAENMAGNISTGLSQQAAAAYYGQAGQNQAQGNNASNIFSGIGDLASIIGL